MDLNYWMISPSCSQPVPSKQKKTHKKEKNRLSENFLRICSLLSLPHRIKRASSRRAQRSSKIHLGRHALTPVSRATRHSSALSVRSLSARSATLRSASIIDMMAMLKCRQSSNSQKRWFELSQAIFKRWECWAQGSKVGTWVTQF